MISIVFATILTLAAVGSSRLAWASVYQNPSLQQLTMTTALIAGNVTAVSQLFLGRMLLPVLLILFCLFAGVLTYIVALIRGTLRRVAENRLAT